MQRRTFIAVTGALLVAPASAQPRAPSLVGTVELRGPQPAHSVAELHLRATVMNNAHQTWRAPVHQLGIAQLCVDVFDAAMHRVPTVPPPVPRPEDEHTQDLGQGQSLTFELTLNVFSPPLPPGRYTAVWGARFGIAQAAPVSFIIAR